jgi:putative transcriptional regulator
MPRRGALCAIAFLLFAAALPVGAQSESEDLAAGKLLVADPEMHDPHFEQVVIVLVRFDEGGAAGLILNRATKGTLAKLFSDDTAKRGQDPVFEGGPVENDNVLGLLKSDTEPEQASKVLGNVYVTPNRKTLDKAVSEGKASTEFRVYQGYCGWAPGQLEAEIDAGVWHVLEGKARLIFDAEPETLWNRLSELSDMRIASARVGTQIQP